MFQLTVQMTQKTGQETSDVLDTWASSWLWSFAVHDWPKDSKVLKTFYPTNALVTGPDIIFFG